MPIWGGGGGGGGTVTSVGTAGLATGGPITGSGTITVPAPAAGIVYSNGTALLSTTIGTGLQLSGSTLNNTGVTSVAIAAPAIFTVSGSPVTTTGTLTLTASGTSGGVPYFNAANTLASSAALTANALVLGGGAGVAPATPLALGTTTQVLHGNAAGAPTWGAVSLTADVSGVLPVANGGTGNAIPYFYVGLPLVGFKFVNVRNISTAAGNNTLYTVPSGKKAICFHYGMYVNDNGVSSVVNVAVNISGVVYRAGSGTTAAANTSTNIVFSANILLAVGDSYVVSDTVGGGAFFGSVLEFDDTVPIYRQVITTVAAANTLYTVPTGKGARILSTLGTNGNFEQGASNLSNIIYVNQSGGAVTRQVYYVQNGGSAGADNRLNAAAGVSVSNDATSTATVPTVMSVGDAIQVDLSSTTATQLIGVTYLEFNV